MAEDKFETREINYRQWLPWTQIFRGFWVAIDPKKLLLAAAGIVTMAFGWWLLAISFYGLDGQTMPTPDHYLGDPKYQPKEGDTRSADQIAFDAFKKRRHQWNLLYAAAGNDSHTIDPGDLSDSPEEFDLLQKAAASKAASKAEAERLTLSAEDATRIQFLLPKGTPRVEPGASKLTYLGLEKRHADLRTWPWFEDRGPNPFLLVTGNAVAWEKGHFFDWLLRDQIPVLIEPLVKFFRPIVYLLNPVTGLLEGIYFLLVIAWTVATWAVFGGTITRMAAVEIARNDKISLGEALRFVLARWKSYIFASFAPVIGLAVCALLLIVFFGIPNWIPIFAEFWVGILWPLALGLGLCMAVILIGLPGWPMIHATLGAEGSDSFDALSRCYSYVLQKPWSYIWYAVVALVYGAIVVFFVGLMGSLTVYLARWAISQTPLTELFNRDASYLFLWAPTSFDWRALLLQGSPVAAVSEPGIALTHWWNYVGPFCIAIWLGLVFLMIVGFGYSFFWSASTIIYLMMRRKVDDTELDEVYLEEEEPEESYTPPAAPSSASSQPPSATSGLKMVEPPSLLRTSASTSSSSPSPSPVAEETAANPGDGNITAGGTASS
jgi:hypothetical protein